MYLKPMAHQSNQPRQTQMFVCCLMAVCVCGRMFGDVRPDSTCSVLSVRVSCFQTCIHGNIAGAGAVLAVYIFVVVLRDDVSRNGFVLDRGTTGTLGRAVSG